MPFVHELFYTSEYTKHEEITKKYIYMQNKKARVVILAWISIIAILCKTFWARLYSENANLRQGV